MPKFLVFGRFFLPRAEFFGTENIEIDTHGSALNCAMVHSRLYCTSATQGKKRITVKASAGTPNPGTTQGGCAGDASMLALSAMVLLVRGRSSRRKGRNSE